MIADLWLDLRYGVRTLLKIPGFALILVATLALGIGVNTEVYSVADAVLFRPLPFAEPPVVELPALPEPPATWVAPPVAVTAPPVALLPWQKPHWATNICCPRSTEA